MLRSRAFVLCCSLVCIALPIGVWYLIASTAVNVPYWDEWEWADLVYKFHLGRLTFADLWVQHNEHRLLFPQLILLGLDRFGGWSPVREQFVSLFFAVCAQIGILILIRRALHGPAVAVTSVAASIIVYGLWQSENFTWGFQMAWFLCNAAVVSAVVLLTAPRRTPLHVLAAMVIAAAASFSSSQGLVAWAAGAVAILTMQRALAPTLPVWLIGAVMSYAVYAYDLAPVTVGHFSVLAHPITGLHYMMAYLGSPVGRSVGVNAVNPSSLAGLIAFGLILVSVIADARGPSRRRHFLRRGPFYALATFPVACAFATASGRAGFGLSQALSSRYTSISGLLWIAAMCIGASYLAGDNAPARVLRRARIPAIALALLALFVYQSDVSGYNDWKSAESDRAAARRGLEQNDSSILTRLYPVNARIELLIDEMRSIHDGPFANG